MTTFTGEDGTDYFRAVTFKAGLKLLKVGIRPNRLWTKTNVLAASAKILGKPGYKNKEIDVAIADLDAWIKERQTPPVEAATVIYPT